MPVCTVGDEASPSSTAMPVSKQAMKLPMSFEKLMSELTALEISEHMGIFRKKLR